MVPEIQPVSIRYNRLVGFWQRHEVSKYIFMLFMVFVIARYMQWGDRRGFLAVLRAEFLLGSVLGVFGILLLVRRVIKFKLEPKLLYSLLILFIIMISQKPFAADPVMSSWVLKEKILKFLVFSFFMVIFIGSPFRLRLFLGAFLFACFYITQESVRGLISGGLVWENQGVMRLHGAVSMYTHPNSLAGLAIGSLTYVIFLFGKARAWWARGFLVALGCTSLVCILYSGSRTVYLGLVVLAAVTFLLATSKKKWLAWALVTVVMGSFIVPQQYIGRFQSIGGQGGSKLKRIEILKDAWIILKENPSGVGLASFPAVRAERFGRTQDTHNLYLEIGTNLGLHGLAAFTAFMIFMLVELSRIRRRCHRLNAVLQKAWRPEMQNAAMEKLVDRQFGDLNLIMATSKATTAFIVVRLALGMFGMDLYEIYWYFGAGLTLVMGHLMVLQGIRVRTTEELIKDIFDSPEFKARLSTP